MKLENLYLIDGKKHLCQHWASQRPEMVDLIHRNVCIIEMVNYEFAARTYYPRRISKSGSDAPLTLHYGIALSVIITTYILHPDEPLIRWV